MKLDVMKLNDNEQKILCQYLSEVVENSQVCQSCWLPFGLKHEYCHFACECIANNFSYYVKDPKSK